MKLPSHFHLLRLLRILYLHSASTYHPLPLSLGLSLFPFFFCQFSFCSIGTLFVFYIFFFLLFVTLSPLQLLLKCFLFQWNDCGCASPLPLSTPLSPPSPTAVNRQLPLDAFIKCKAFTISCCLAHTFVHFIYLYISICTLRAYPVIRECVAYNGLSAQFIGIITLNVFVSIGDI